MFKNDDESIGPIDISTTFLKGWDSFQHPMNGGYSYNLELEYQIQIASKMFPEYPCRSLAQA